MNLRRFPDAAPNGFTLVELALVLIIVTLLTSGLMVSLSAQQEATTMAETQRRLNDARDALLGYAAANGRLPCPAAPGSTGVEAPDGGGACANPWDGFLPAVTLGIGPTNADGYALDSWGNPIRYAITHYRDAANCLAATNDCFATANGIKAVWDATAGTSTKPSDLPDLNVCNTAAGMTGSGDSAKCASGTELTQHAVAIVFSRGKNGGATPTRADEMANGDADRLFVSHSPSTAAGSEFDDLVIWLSPNILYNRLLSAGRLP